MSLLKSLILAFKSDSDSFEMAKIIHDGIASLTSYKSSLSPIELNEAVLRVTNDKIIAQRVLQAVNFNTLTDDPKPIDFNRIFDAILEELNKRKQL